MCSGWQGRRKRRELGVWLCDVDCTRRSQDCGVRRVPLFRSFVFFFFSLSLHPSVDFPFLFAYLLSVWRKLNTASNPYGRAQETFV
jgi:hypothetical protein